VGGSGAAGAAAAIAVSALGGANLSGSGSLGADDTGDEPARPVTPERVAGDCVRMRKGVSEVGLRLAEGEEVVAGDTERVDAACGVDEVGAKLLEPFGRVAIAGVGGEELVVRLLGPDEGAVPAARLVLVTAAGRERRGVDRVGGGEGDRQAVVPEDGAGDVKRLEPVIGAEPRAEVESVVVGARLVERLNARLEAAAAPGSQSAPAGRGPSPCHRRARPCCHRRRPGSRRRRRARCRRGRRLQ